jgi:dTDP-4-amino-4,6-dideoxygalactose transaminase
MQSSRPPIYVTQPDLPPLDEVVELLRGIWERKILTNGGPCHQQLERALADHLAVPFLSLFNNGTIALMTAIKAFDLQGEVITTPYSFVATAHSLVWSAIEPVFVDVDPETFNLDPRKIEAAITPRTTAIMPVHCYGNPCDVSAIKAIADRYGLRVIYDAAHAFGVRDEGGSILRHGDLSVLSFHATKVFNTLEGGAIVSHDAVTKAHIDRLKNFGFTGEISVADIGLNGKMNEIQAAFGLAQLPRQVATVERRRRIAEKYRAGLTDLPGIRIPAQPRGVTSNYSYFPILVGPTFRMTRDELHEHLKFHGVNGRRYFYPLICDFAVYAQRQQSSRMVTPQAHALAEQVLCLPIYPALLDQEVERVIDLIQGVQ